MAFGENIERKFHDLNESYKNDRNVVELKDSLREAIRFNSEVLE